MRSYRKCGAGEVETRDAFGTESGERESVSADVTLQMHYVEAVDTAETRKIEAHHVRQMRRIGSKLLESVGLLVMRHPAVPIRQVDSHIIAHRDIVSRPSTRNKGRDSPG